MGTRGAVASFQWAMLGALLALLRVLERVEVGARRDRDALDADGDARAVHHLEHLRHALVDLLFSADRPADALAVVAEVEDAGGRAVDAHLVLERADATSLVSPSEPSSFDRTRGR